MTDVIYFDNAATAGRRPEAVGRAMLEALREASAPAWATSPSASERSSRRWHYGRLAIVSFTVEGMSTSDVARGLERRGVLCRPGLHCAPRAHRTLGTFPGGTVRFSLSAFNTRDEVTRAAAAVRDVVRYNRPRASPAPSPPFRPDERAGWEEP